jgi:hypothetical protein
MTPIEFTAEEQEFLVTLLQAELKEMLVEEHRTRAPTYRQHILRNEELIRGLLARLAGSSVKPADLATPHSGH